MPLEVAGASTSIEIRYALDTFYLLMTGILVMFMAAGFAMLEAGLVRAKNTAEILTKNITLYAVACIMYMLVGYNLMYPGENTIIAGILPHFTFLLGGEQTAESILAGTASKAYALKADFFFQVVFVATSMSVVSGAVAERMKLWAFLVFAVVMTGFIYPIQGYWKWGGGWLEAIPFLSNASFKDFAGSGIVHLCGATAALAGVLLLGARKGKYGANGQVNPMPGANLPLATLGTMILWFGWFGFNGGSQLKLSTIADANTVAAVIVNTNMAACGGLVAAILVARILFGKADLSMILNGILAGLVAITAEPSTPTASFAVMIGAVGGVLVVFSIVTLDKMRVDDPVGAISVHGIAGVWGLLAVPITNTSAKFSAQFIGVLSIFGWVFVTSLIVWSILKFTIGIRMSEEEEYEGADISECGLEAYPEFMHK
ncbi:ammonium transporter [Beggiatoa leptomitoformis]|uniref:Ammonium transporter n=1 Tax=Beggiatoa leptomitoformis TaxID=288004 RepID=A0A2N9YI97_9GAMM|nr:ammonium transporter [Beggiatoa leptomitoformis]AUI70095.1 ammonium transporter [Beggiatoa leptomitoformis]QGX03637.1 ammonium transporter [Beggiatoa leptomitoformis]